MAFPSLQQQNSNLSIPPMTYPLFFGCLFVAFGIPATTFLSLVLPKSQLVIVSVSRSARLSIHPSLPNSPPKFCPPHDSPSCVFSAPFSGCSL